MHMATWNHKTERCRECWLSNKPQIDRYPLPSPAPPGAPLTEARILPTRVNFLRQLNEQDGPMLLCGSVDGAVRVWRNYTLKEGHNMATALQVQGGAELSGKVDCRMRLLGCTLGALAKEPCVPCVLL